MRTILMTLMLAVLAMPVLATEAESTSQAEQQVEAILQLVENDKVCMVNDRFMGSEQIPVEVEGKTYYGCCMMCKAKLEQNAAIRTAIDPVSGVAVDKATAVIGADEYHQVYYFENAEHMASFDPEALTSEIVEE